MCFNVMLRFLKMFHVRYFENSNLLLSYFFVSSIDCLNKIPKKQWQKKKKERKSKEKSNDRKPLMYQYIILGKKLVWLEDFVGFSAVFLVVFLLTSLNRFCS